MVRDKQPLVTNVTIAPSGSSLVVSWTGTPSKITYSVTIYSNTSESTAGSTIFQTASGISATTYTSVSLTTTDFGKYYFAMVQAINFDNSSYTAPYSSIIFAPTQPPTAVTMAAYTVGSTSISVSWSPSPSAQSYTVQFYKADTSATTDRTNLINTVSSATSPTSYNGISSTDYNKYFYAVVTANNTNGNQSAVSSSGVLVFAAAPSAPTNVTITQVGSSASVTWTAAEYATSYTVNFFRHTSNSITAGTNYDSGSTSSTSLSREMDTSTIYFYYATVSASNSTGTSSTVKTAYAISYGSGCVTIAGSKGIIGTANGYGDENSYNDPFFGSMDTDGNLYITSKGANVIQKLTIPGCQGSTFSSTTTIANPRGSVVYNGFLYVCDESTGIKRISLSDGSVTTFAQLVGAFYITSDGAGGFYATVIDSPENNYYWNSKLYRITSSGSVSLIRNFNDDGGGFSVRGMAYHPPTGDLYFTSIYGLYRFPSGSSTYVPLKEFNGFPILSGLKMNYNNTAVYYCYEKTSIAKYIIATGEIVLRVVGQLMSNDYVDSLNRYQTLINHARDIIPMNNDLGIYILERGDYRPPWSNPFDPYVPWHSVRKAVF